MTNTKQKVKRGIHPVTAGAVGAAIGAAAVGIAGVAALANKASRKKVEKVIDDAKRKAIELKKGGEKQFARGKVKVNKQVKKVVTAVKKVV